MTWDPERAVDGDGADEEGAYPPLPCVACGADTSLRCARCGEPVCEIHEACPNGCDGPGEAAPMRPVADLARALRERLHPRKPHP